MIGCLRETVVTYWEYYNYGLADYLKHRMINKIGFTQ